MGRIEQPAHFNPLIRKINSPIPHIFRNNITFKHQLNKAAITLITNQIKKFFGAIRKPTIKIKSHLLSTY